MKNNETDIRPKAAGKREIILIAVILLAALLFFFISRMRRTNAAAIVEISIDGNPVETFDLNTDREYLIQSTTGGTNRLIIEDGKAWISEATCPDKVCIHQGKISHDGELIVCLPNLLVVKVIGETDEP